MNRTDTMCRCTLCVFLILSYIIACSVNFMAAMKFPDGELQTSHAIASLLFWLSLLAYATYGRSHFGLNVHMALDYGTYALVSSSLYFVAFVAYRLGPRFRISQKN